MKVRVILCSIVFALVTGTVHARAYQGFDDRYLARVGDLNGDSRSDIFVQRRAEIVPILLDDLSVPVRLKDPVSEVLLQQDASGGFSRTEMTSAQRAIATKWPATQLIQLLVRDLNIDGFADLILKNVGAAVAGGQDAVIFAPTTPQSNPSVVRSADADFRMFFRDVAGWTEDKEHYYDPGWYETCVPGLAYVPVLHIDADGFPYYTYELVPVTVCGWAFDPTGFSIPALDYLNAVVPRIQEGTLVRGSQNGTIISQQLRQLFGVSFMRNVLEDPSVTPDFDPNVQQNCTNPTVTESNYCGSDLLARVLLSVGRHIATQWFDCFDSGPATHHYEVDTAVCMTGASRCNLPEVYQNEMLVHPVVGYWQNPRPIYDIANARWNPPAPDGYATMGCTLDVPNACDPYGAADGGPIVFSVSPQQYSHTNSTVAPHIFDPGTITRTARVQANQVFIKTVGAGTGACPRTNEEQGMQIFKTLDAFTKCHLNGGCTVNHPIGQ